MFSIGLHVLIYMKTHELVYYFPYILVMDMLKSVDQVKAEFNYKGITMSQWAREHNYPYYIVQHVLSGQSKFTHGKAHEIAVLLGLKEGVIE